MAGLMATVHNEVKNSVTCSTLRLHPIHGTLSHCFTLWSGHPGRHRQCALRLLRLLLQTPCP